LPSFENLRKKLAGRPFEVLAIDVGEEETQVKNFIEQKGLTFPVLLDTDGHVSKLYDVRSHPRTFIVSPEGNLIGIAVGYRKWDSDAMLLLMTKLLEEITDS